jgi:membrane-associated phospholipid phosphatase
MLDWLRNYDLHAFYFVNLHLQNSFFDFIMPIARNPVSWIPLYAIILFFVIKIYKKQSWKIFVITAINVLITDQLSSSVIKPWIRRLRPCNNPVVSIHMHQLVACGSGFSFVSSHACNHFGLALIFIFIFKNYIKWIIPATLFWATLISFAQVYVGLHYPVDVICGGMLGSMIGFTNGKILQSWIRR